MATVGVDGCRLGWLCIEADNGEWSAEVHPTIARVWERYHGAELILIDIPIGLWDAGDRQRLCDTEARRVLGPRRASVFTPPLRPSLARPDYQQASDWNRSLSGRKLSRQTWGIIRKIHQVDQFFSAHPEARDVLREAHPEVLFWSLNGAVPMAHAKKSSAGAAERRKLLAANFPAAREVLAYVRARHLKREVADDDVLDALVAAVSAARCVRGNLATLPATPETDARGLPMEMVYCAQ